MSFSSSAPFLDAVKRLHLLEADQLKEVERTLVSRLGQPQALARELVQRGWLSPYQVNELFRGRGQDLLLGSYVLMEKLGEGGMGAVYKARNWKLGQVVAIKLIRKDRLTHAGAVQRFQREIRAAAHLDHPNIVRALDADQVGDINFFAMEYVEGTDLAKIVKSQGPLPVTTACEYVRQAAVGLQHAYERGLVHRDLKPANLLVASGGREPPGGSPHQGARAPRSPGLVKILDMGLARRENYEGEESSTLTQEGVVMGTPDYMAPEQALDSHLADIRADLYSLGCTFFFLLTGHVPFPGGTMTQKVMRHQLDNPPPVEQVRPDVPAWVGGIIRKLLAKKPQDRYQTPAELAAALEMGEKNSNLPTAVPGQLSTSNPFADLSGGQTEIVQYTPMPARRRLAPSRWWLAGAGAALVLLLAVWILLARRGGNSPGADDNRETALLTVPVDANRPWQDTGIDLHNGREVSIVCRNRWGKKNLGTCAAFGEKEAPRDRNLAATEPAFCLLGRIGDQDPPVNLGSLATFTPDRGGRLFVRINHLDLADLTGTIQLEIRGRVQRSEEKATTPAPTRIERAEALIADLQAREAAPKTDRLELRRDLLDFRRSYYGTYQAITAAGLLARLRSPLDDIDPAQLPAWELLAAGQGDPAKAPPGLVAVLGDSRLRHWQVVRTGAFSPDGKFLVTNGAENTLTIWDVKTGRPLHILPHIYKAPYMVFAFTPDSKLLITAPVNGDNTITTWDVATGKEYRAWQTPAAFQDYFPMAVRQTDAVLAVGHGDGVVTLWDSGRGKKIMEFKSGLERISALALSPDGKWLAAGNGNLNDQKPCHIKLWDVTDAKLSADSAVSLTQLKSTTHALSFSPDSKALVACVQGESILYLWDLNPAQPKLQTCKPFKDDTRIDDAFFSPTGKHLAVAPSGRYDTLLGEINGLDLVNRLDLQGYRPLAFSPDSATLATQTPSGAVHWVDLATIKERPPDRPPQPAIEAVAVSPDCARLATADQDGKLRIWDATKAKELQSAPSLRTLIHELAYSPDGTELVVAGNHAEALICDAQTGAEVRRFLGHQGATYGVAFSPDGKQLATVNADRSVRVWDRASAKELNVLEGHTGESLGVAFRPDGLVLASSGQDGLIRLWETDTGKRLRSLSGHAGAIRRVAFSPDGKMIASAGYDQTLRIWNAETGKVLHVLDGHKAALWWLAFSPDGATLISGSENGKLILWDVAAGKMLRQWQLPGGAAAGAFASDGRHLVTANRNGTAYVIRLGPPAYVPPEGPSPATPSPFDSLQSDQIAPYERKVAGGGDPDKAPTELVAILGDSRLKHTEKVQAVAFASDGRWIVSGGWDRIIRFWHSANGEELSASTPLIERVFSLVLNKDETMMAAGHENGSITIADIEGPRLTSQLIFKAHEGRVSALAWSPDGQILASANWGKDKTIKLWEVATGKKLAEFSLSNNVNGLVFSGDGNTLYASSATILSWDLTNRTRPREAMALKGIDGAWITRLALSADGKHLAASFSNGAVKVWEIPAGQEKKEIRLSKAATALAFDKTGAKLYVGRSDGVLQSVELATGQVAFSLLAHVGAVLDVTCSPDGTRLVTAGEEGAVKAWDTETGKELLPVESHTGVLSRLAISHDGSRIVASGADHTLRTWDVKSRHSSLICRGHRQWSGSVAFDASGSRLVSSSLDGTVRIWDAKAGQQSFICYDSKQVPWWVAFSPDGTRLAAGLNTGAAKVWDASTGRELLTLEGHQRPVVHVGFSADGQKLATAGNDMSVKVWNIDTGGELHSITGFKHNPVETAFLADSTRLAIGWSDGNIRSYDLRTGREDLSFKGLGGGTRALSASPDGKYLAAATSAGRILVWETATAKKIHDWGLPVTITHLAFAPDGRHLVTANLNATMYVFRLKSP